MASMRSPQIRLVYAAPCVFPVELQRLQISSTKDADVPACRLGRCLSYPGRHDRGSTMSEIEAGVEGRAWTRREVEAVVGIYLHMLRMQLMGQTPNKTE